MPYTTTYVNGKKIVLDENGKPCRTCNSLQDLMMFAGSAATAGSSTGSGATTPPSTPPPTGADATSSAGPSAAPAAYTRDPPDSLELGNSTWTFLHSLPTQYPERASPNEQKTMSTFLYLFGKVYPCPPCAADFRDYIDENPPQVQGRRELGQWLCEAHNEVNDKLGKPTFDCRTWRERWMDGWYKK